MSEIVENNLEYIEKRSILSNQVPSSSVIVIYGANVKFRNADAEYLFRQDSNFYYLTGLNEPDNILVIIKNKENNIKTILFNLPKIWEKEQWTGKRIGQEMPCKELGFDESYPVENFDKVFTEILKEVSNIYYDKNQQNIEKYQNKSENPSIKIYTIIPFLSKMRMIKFKSEIQLIKKAVDLSVNAHRELIKKCHNNLSESDLSTEFEYLVKKNGCNSLAYNTIVGGGSNSCILHYVENNKNLTDGDLVLIDAGGEYKNYAADITRTFPVNGTFSPEQKAIYNLVLQAQLAGINAVYPGNSWDNIQKEILNIIIPGLIELGLLSGEKNKIIEDKSYRKFYMHNSGHWLGLDVHDLGLYKENDQAIKLESGMVLTVEPGIYISEIIKNIDPKWYNIGIRIEDDILVTEEGHEVLSKELPKSIQDLENLMSNN